MNRGDAESLRIRSDREQIWKSFVRSTKDFQICSRPRQLSDSASTRFIFPPIVPPS
jgi:hypothetical protein